FTPGLPHLQRQFHISAASTQLTVSLFLLGYTIGPLIYGPLANRHGRKNMLYVGISIAFVSSLLCAIASHIGGFVIFLVARFMLAIGASAGLTLTFTIISDVCTDTEQRRKMIAYTTLAFAIMPGLAVSVGGLLVASWGWQSCFYVYMLYCLLVAFLVSRLPETKPLHFVDITLKKMWVQYCLVARDSKLWLYSLIWGSTTGVIYTFSAIAPIISHDSLHIPPDVFGVYNLWVFMGLAIGNILAAKLAMYFSARKVMAAGIVVALSGALFLLLSTMSGNLTAAHFFLWTTLSFLGMPAIFCNASALATAQCEDKATASSLMNSVDLCMAIIVLSVMGLVTVHMAEMMSGLFVGMLIIVLLLFGWAGRR
ncbi:MAG: hypothetical protein K0R48_437, partial [Gammaproteobacteria bacterium]|nr:hypothetical protein [Gammaproteobacteria bacterium]